MDPPRLIAALVVFTAAGQVHGRLLAIEFECLCYAPVHGPCHSKPARRRRPSLVG